MTKHGFNFERTFFFAVEIAYFAESRKFYKSVYLLSFNDSVLYFAAETYRFKTEKVRLGVDYRADKVVVAVRRELNVGYSMKHADGRIIRNSFVLESNVESNEVFFLIQSVVVFGNNGKQGVGGNFTFAGRGLYALSFNRSAHVFDRSVAACGKSIRDRA